MATNNEELELLLTAVNGTPGWKVTDHRGRVRVTGPDGDPILFHRPAKTRAALLDGLRQDLVGRGWTMRAPRRREAPPPAAGPSHEEAMAIAGLTGEVTAEDKAGARFAHLEVTVDPDLAALMMSRNKPSNRRMNPGIVSRYAQAMEAGHWKHTHQGLAFDLDGYLIDGQHRLAAVIQSGATITVDVSYNLPTTVYGDLDGPRRRSIGDAVHSAGHGNAVLLAAAARLLHLYDHHREHPESWKGIQPDPDTIISVIDRNPGLAETAALWPRLRRVGFSPRAGCVSVYLLRRACGPGDKRPDEFWEGVFDGAPAGDPRMRLRDNLMNAKMRDGRSRAAHEQVALAVKAFNSWSAGGQLTILAHRKGSALPEVNVPAAPRGRR